MKYDESGNKLAETGTPPGERRQIAVDPTSGDVYATGYNEVAKINSSGVFLFGITETPRGSIEPTSVAVGPEGDLYVADHAQGAIDRFGSSGEYLGQFAVPGITSIYRSYLAAGPEGDLYVGLGEQVGEVRRYTTSGAPDNCPGGSNSLSLGAGGELPVAVDPSDGHLFVGEASAEGDFVAEYASFCVGVPSSRLVVGEAYSGSAVGQGIGVSGSTHRVYIGNYNRQDAQIYGLVTLPTVTTSAPATNVTRTSATVSGTVSPEGAEVTTCEFEYGPTFFYGHTQPCSPEPPFTAGQVTVKAELAFLLAPGDVIHYRLKAGGAAGDEFGAEQTITRPATPPVIGGLPASNVSQFAATLNATLETGESLVNYHFEYGTTAAYGSVEPIPDGYAPITNESVAITQPIQGLQAGTIYHYRLIASSPGGTNAAGPDETFTTLPIPAPTVATGAAEGVGVGAATLNGTIDPHGWDTTYLFEYGTSTAYGQSWPTVPVDMGALEGPQPVVVGVSNLQPGTTYHYRLVATNGGGTTYGPDMTFTTGEYPAQIIQEPIVLRTLLVPTGGETAKASSKHGKKAKKGRKHTKSRHRARGKKK